MRVHREAKEKIEQEAHTQYLSDLRNLLTEVSRPTGVTPQRTFARGGCHACSAGMLPFGYGTAHSTKTSGLRPTPTTRRLSRSATKSLPLRSPTDGGQPKAAGGSGTDRCSLSSPAAPGPDGF